MSTTMEDILEDELISKLHNEAIMKRAALEQCIYIFVEGDSEEATFQMLLENPGCGLNFQENGIVIANYNGAGNLKHALRLLRKTLSHDRPIIVTFDDDLAGKRIVGHLNDPLIYSFCIPNKPVVTYTDGTEGGSFEEAFSPRCFLEACFQSGVLEPSFSGTLSDFSAVFDNKKPYLNQFKIYIKNNGGKPGSINKVLLAKYMARTSNPVPDTFIKLAKIALDLRKSNPVRHFDDVELSG